MVTVVTTAGFATAIAAFTLTASVTIIVVARRALGANHIGLIDTIEADLAAIANLNDLDLNDVSDVKNIFNLAHTAVSHTRDVEQTILAGSKTNECAKILNANDFAVIHFSDLGNLDDTQDSRLGSSATFGIDGSNTDGAVFFDLDSGIRLILKTSNNLATRTDNITNLIGRNMDGLNVRSVRRASIASSIAFMIKARPSLA